MSEALKPKRPKVPPINGMVSHQESMRRLKRDRPEVYKALKDPDPRACLAWNVIEYRSEKILSQRALAEKADVSLWTVAYIEDYEAEFSPSIQIVQKLAKALGVKFTDLFETVDMTK